MKSSSLVTPLGFKPKTFRTFFWPHSAKKAILFQATK